LARDLLRIAGISVWLIRSIHGTPGNSIAVTMIVKGRRAAPPERYLAEGGALPQVRRMGRHVSLGVSGVSLSVRSGLCT
jgi:hypothetical protein